MLNKNILSQSLYHHRKHRPPESPNLIVTPLAQQQEGEGRQTNRQCVSSMYMARAVSRRAFTCYQHYRESNELGPENSACQTTGTILDGPGGLSATAVSMDAPAGAAWWWRSMKVLSFGRVVLVVVAMRFLLRFCDQYSSSDTCLDSLHLLASSAWTSL